jgi:ABC-2 type transport system permease protein
MSNLIGLRTVYYKETYRFAKVYNQTLFAPVVNAMLFFAIFSLAIGSKVEHIGEIDFKIFMVAGLVMMTAMQNSFANSSSSFTMGKVLGNIVDYLMPPLGAKEIIIGMVAAAVTRGFIVGVLVALVASIFVDLPIQHPLYAVAYLILASILLGLVGTLTGIFVESFDQMSAISSYVIVPLTFLSGTFYSVKSLPEFWYNISQFNPFFYMIDGFRYGLTGHTDTSNPLIGIIYISCISIIIYAVTYHLIKTGYRIKQ